MRVFRHLIWIAAIFAGMVLGLGVVAAQQPAATDQPPAAQQPAAADQPAATPTPIPAETCLGCHGYEGFSVPDDKGGTRDLHIDKDKFLKSVHGTRNCVDCHQQITEVPHQKINRSR